ncbi:MAG: thioredoxin family protein [Candidatus Woesearchaeota archaeon]
MALMQSNENAIPLGGDAPIFKLKNTVDGKEVSLSDFKGKPICIIFMCNHCPYVVPKMDEIKELQDGFGDKVEILCINPNNNPAYEADSFENSTKLALEKGYKYYLFDETQEVAKAYGAVCTPDPYVFNSEHKLIYHGRINDDLGTTNNPTSHDLREVLQSIVDSKEIEDWFKPSQGCSIKWV